MTETSKGTFIESFVTAATFLFVLTAGLGMISNIIYHLYVWGEGIYQIIAANKSDFLMDIWSFQHLLSGFLIASMLPKEEDGEPSLKVWFYLILALYFWEVIELQMELGHVHPAITNWMRGVEHPLNRWLFDPLLAMIGADLYPKFKRWIKNIWYWRAASAAFIFTHIFIVI